MSEADFFQETPIETDPNNTAEELTVEYQNSLESLRKGVGAAVSKTMESVESQQTQRAGLVNALESLQENSSDDLTSTLIKSIETGKETK